MKPRNARAHLSATAGILSDTCVQGMRFMAKITRQRLTMHYLVQVPEARGNVIPEMASMSDDFPADCDPKAAMMGMSSSR
jgi:hypothetical protein